jgi:hypothetical protein
LAISIPQNGADRIANMGSRHNANARQNQPTLKSFWLGELAAVRSLLWKRNRDCLFVSAYLWGKTTHEMNDYLSSAICEFHVQAIGTVLWGHHGNIPPKKTKHKKTKEPLPQGPSLREPAKRLSLQT